MTNLLLTMTAIFSIAFNPNGTTTISNQQYDNQNLRVETAQFMGFMENHPDLAAVETVDGNDWAFITDGGYDDMEYNEPVILIMETFGDNDPTNDAIVMNY